MKATIMTIGLALTMSAAHSQNYWVVETNKDNHSLVKIYNSQNQLLSESRYKRRIDINKRRERKKLDKMARSRGSGSSLWSKR